MTLHDNPLSGTLEDSIPSMKQLLDTEKVEDMLSRPQETYALFATPITQHKIQGHNQLKVDILNWMSNNNILEKHNRQAICHNISQIGDTNKLIHDIPQIGHHILDAVNKHNYNSYKYETNFGIQESYLELAHKGAIYAPHEHSNCLFSVTYFINYDSKVHSYLKWRRNVSSNFYPVIQIDSKELTPFNMIESTFLMEEGDIIVYPANLTHGFDENPSGERITLTANIIPIE